MAEQKVSARYASSLLDSAIEKNQLDLVSNDIDFKLKFLELLGRD